MKVVDWAVIGSLVGWFVLTAITQVRVERCQRLRRLDVIGALPGWNFFAPRPISQDFRLHVRVWTGAGRPGRWRAVPVIESRRLRHAVFNHHRRAKKAFFTMCVDVSRAVATGRYSSARIMHMTSYINLLEHASRAVGPAWGVQFRIVLVSYGPDGSRGRPVVVSALHRTSRIAEPSIEEVDRVLVDA